MLIWRMNKHYQKKPKEVSATEGLLDSTSESDVLSNDLASNATEALTNLVVDVEDEKDGDVVMTELTGMEGSVVITSVVDRIEVSTVELVPDGWITKGKHRSLRKKRKR